MTSTDKKKDTLAILAHIASDIVSPMLVPSYAMVAAMCLTPLPPAPLRAQNLGNNRRGIYHSHHSYDIHTCAYQAGQGERHIDIQPP